MEVCQHKRSKKYFIYIHAMVDGKALFVTPEGNTKALYLDDFYEPEEWNEDDLRSSGLMTDEQIPSSIDMSDEFVQKLHDALDSMTPAKRKELFRNIKKDTI